MAIAASRLALDDAGLNLKKIEKDRIGVCVGTTMGEASVLEQMDSVWVKSGDEKIDYGLILQYPTSTLSANVSNELKIKGNNFLFPTACSAGNYAIGYSYDLIRNNQIDFMIAGGVDAFSRINLVGFSRLYAMAPEICRPFDKNREGMLVGEGAGIMLLESLDSAKKRKAPIYAEVLGYGLSCDAYHMTAPKEEGIIEAMKKAIKDAKVNKEEIDYISAHGTGTIQNDKTECSAIKTVFNDSSKKTPISSIK